jgi:phosphate acetyltransferase
MNMMEKIYEKARENPQKVAFPEATEEKILLSAREAKDNGICNPVLVGDAAQIEHCAALYKINLEGLAVMDSSREAWLDCLIDTYTQTHPLNSVKTMKRKSKDPLYIALMMEAVGEVDCTFAGLSHTTGDVISAAQLVIGLQENVSTVSSIGILDIPGFEGSEGQLLGFGDSAVCADPTADELAGIAISACESVRSLLGWEPRCALLSFSTVGSADHPLVDKVKNAVALANQLRPDLKIDGEFQLDSAISPKVAAKKVNRPSEVAGIANIIIWPDLNAGNIGVKLVQQFARANAYGPMLQGFAKVVSDCSRGAPVPEIVGNIAMTVVRAQGDKQ